MILVLGHVYRPVREFTDVSGKSQHSSYMERARRAERIRPAVQKALERADFREAESLSGFNRTSLHAFVTKQTVPHERNLQKLEDWVEREGLMGKGGQGEESGAGEQPPEAEGDDSWLGVARGFDADLQKMLIREVDAIRRLDEPEWRKALYRDSLGSLIGRAAALAAEVARKEAEAAARVRARVLLETERNGETRQRRRAVWPPERPRTDADSDADAGDGVA